MSKYEEGSSRTSARERAFGMWYAVIFFALLVALGLSIWSGIFELSGQKNQVAKDASDRPNVARPSASPLSQPLIVKVDAPPSPFPTTTALAFALVKLPTATTTPAILETVSPPTAIATITSTKPAPTQAERTKDNSQEKVESVLTTATREPWPTTNPENFVVPQLGFDQDRAHIWFSRPVEGNNVPSAPYRFGMTYNQRLQPHHGLDIANEPGTPVVAVGAGTVFYAGEDIDTLFGPKPDFYGRVVVIETSWRWQGHVIYTLYGHLESINVTDGQTVSSGDVLGRVGSSGVALGPHLHFEVRQDDAYDYDSVRNPELWYWSFDGRGILAGRVVDNKGVFMPGTRVNLDCSDAAVRYVETYWDQFTPPDDGLVENFAISDLPVGTCRVWANLLGEIVEQLVDIRAGELSTVVLQAPPK